MNVKILTLVIVLLVSLLCSAGAGEYTRGRPRRSSSPSSLVFAYFSSSVCVVFVQAAVVDQLPSMVSLVWALKDRNLSTWLCTVLHCSGSTATAFILNLNVGSTFDSSSCPLALPGCILAIPGGEIEGAGLLMC